MLCLQVSKVKGHATRAMVDSGDVRLDDLVGNNGADAAAALGRLRQQDEVITARRDLLRVRRYWYPIIFDLHKFMVAISRIEVNHDGFGGTAPDAMVWDKGGIVKTRASSFRLIVDHATLLGPPGFLSSTWCTLYLLPITQEGVAVWPYSVNILLVFSSFLASLHWPQGNPDFGKIGISYFELLLMFEIFAGHRLHAEKAIRPHLRPRRPLGFSGFSVGKGQEIRHGCQFLHSLFRALGHLPGGLVRFIPCQPSAHYTRLLHVGWEQCGHGLSSRPRESCDLQFLTPLLDFFGYPDGAATELFNGTLKLRYSSTPFPRNFHLGRCLISLVIIRWLVPVLDPVFIFRIMILFSSVQRNEFVSQVRVPLSGVLLFLGMVFQRPSDGKG